LSVLTVDTADCVTNRKSIQPVQNVSKGSCLGHILGGPAKP